MKKEKKIKIKQTQNPQTFWPKNQTMLMKKM